MNASINRMETQLQENKDSQSFERYQHTGGFGRL